MLNEKVDRKGVSGAASSHVLELSCAASCARSLAASSSLELQGAIDGAKLVRGDYDSQALKKAHHDEQVQLQLTPKHVISRSLFNIMEQERFEALGANLYVGVRTAEEDNNKKSIPLFSDI